MDEMEMGYTLGPGALDKMSAADIAKLEPQEALILRALQSGEYYERAVTERELEQLIEFYEQNVTDTMLIEMTIHGDIFFSGFNEDGEPVFGPSPQGTAKLRSQAKRDGVDLPTWMAEELLDDGDL